MLIPSRIGGISTKTRTWVSAGSDSVALLNCALGSPFSGEMRQLATQVVVLPDTELTPLIWSQDLE